MPEFGYPGLPVLSQDEIARRNAARAEWRRPSMDELRRASEEESFRISQAEAGLEPTTEELLNQAKQTLEDTAPTQIGLNIAARNARGEGPATSEGFAPRPTTTYRDVADQTLGAASFIPGPVGAAARLGSGALGAYDMATEGPSLGNAMQVGFGALEAVPASMKILRSLTAKGPGPIRPDFASNVGRAPRVLSDHPPMQVRGELPSVDTPALPRHNMRNVSIEGPANSPFRSMGTTRSPEPGYSTGQGMNVPGRLQFDRPTPSNLEVQGNLLTPGAKGPGSPSVPSGPVYNPLSGLDEGADLDLTAAINDLAEESLSPEVIARARAAERFGQNFRSEGGAPARIVPSMQSLQRLTPEEMLAGGDEASMRSVLFGGPQDEAGFVRPQQRSPISKGSLSRKGSRKK